MRVLSLIRGFISCFSLTFLIGSFLYPYASAERLLIVVAVAGAILQTEKTLILFLVLLPVFGNKPGTEQVHYLLLIAAALQLGLQRITAPLKKGEISNRLIFFLLLYVCASLFSLTSLPLQKLWFEARSAMPDLSPSTILMSIVSFTRAREDSPAYSPLSVLLTGYSFLFGYFCYLLVGEKPKRAYLYGGAIAFGLIVSLVVGLLDYYGVIDLRFFRSLDPIVNPGDIQFRLQSFFGHSGWFAEYITLSIPFVILLLQLPIRYSYRVAIILLLLLLAEAVLILTYQRGGWISYPLTLCVIWMAIYTTRLIEQGQRDLLSGIKKTFIKVIISLPLTVLCTVLLLSFLSTGSVVGGAAKENAQKYLSRFQDIQKTSDRTEFIKAGFKIGILHPLFGAGSESFFTAFEKEFVSKKGHYYGEANLPLHGSAHNVYMQTFSGKGIVGLLFLLLSVFYMIYQGLRLSLREEELDYDLKLFLLVCSCFCFAFLIYGNVQEVFYVQALQYQFFVVLGLGAGVMNGNSKISSKQQRVWWGVLCVLLVFHLSMENTRAGWDTSQPIEFGCYRPEKNEKKQNIRWCGPEARKLFSIKSKRGEEVIHFAIVTHIVKNQEGHATFEVSYQNEVLLSKEVEALKEYPITIPVTEGLRKKLQKRELESSVLELNLKLNSYFIPKRDYDRSNDRRVLSYQLVTGGGKK